MVRIQKFLPAGVLFAALAVAAPAWSSVIVVGAPADTYNCFPFGCGYEWTPDYQQVYASSQFSGPLDISDIIFYDTLDPGTPQIGTFTLSLSTTSAAVGALSRTPATNIGGDNTEVFTGALPAIVSGEMEFVLSTPFDYDPTNGNLLLTVTATGLNTGSDSLYLDANTKSGVSSREFGGSTDGEGLVTGFDVGSETTVPEPASIALLGAALVGLAALRRPRQRPA